MSQLVSYLESFNRKERFFLVGKALGNSRFGLCDAFRAEIGNVFDVTVPANAFVAMDYHLDWLHAALVLSGGGAEESVHSNAEHDVHGNQEDIDLLVAFEAEGVVHLLLLEAKAETGWTNKQMHSKAQRLAGIFGQEGQRYPLARPQLALLSPREPQQLQSERWPAWMVRGDGKPRWLRLRVPDGLRRVERCDADGRACTEGAHFRIVKQ
jgi:hypothetical protein